ncbi:hypothetical protein HMPREF3156_02321 [Neisseria sp. HMSC06F02]|nr:hypothetical protein HMPREF3156_02321 [Neisseria sp. HMSC06F02]
MTGSPIVGNGAGRLRFRRKGAAAPAAVRAAIAKKRRRVSGGFMGWDGSSEKGAGYWGLREIGLSGFAFEWEGFLGAPSFPHRIFMVTERAAGDG